MTRQQATSQSGWEAAKTERRRPKGARQRPATQQHAPNWNALHRPTTCGPEGEGKREVQHAGASVHPWALDVPQHPGSCPWGILYIYMCIYI